MSSRAEELLADPIIGRLRAMRNALGMSIADAAQHAGMSVAAVGSYERGERSPSVPTMRALLSSYRYDLLAASADEMLVPLRPGEAGMWAEWLVVIPDTSIVVPATDRDQAKIIAGHIPFSAVGYRVHRVSPLVR